MTEVMRSRAKLAVLAVGFLTILAAKLDGSLGEAPLFKLPWIFYGALALTGVIGAATVLKVVFPGRQNPLVLFVITLLAGALAWLTHPSIMLAS